MDSDDEMDIMAKRAETMAQISNMFGDAFTEAQKIIDDVKEDLNGLEFTSDFPKSVIRHKRKRSDEIFRFTGIIPTEIRKSARLSNTKPRYSYADLENLVGVEGDDPVTKDPDFYFDLEEIIREPVTKRKSISNRSSLPPMRAPEEITERELSNIAKRSGNKTYSQMGTSCHQCRQKTVDTKTFCRSGKCIGVRGQFCGPCLKNRYGEDAREALLDHNWACPPCRNLCNCSICRTRQGKRPTGILAPTVQQEGFSSVKDFLLNLAEKGILSQEINYNTTKLSPEKRNINDVLYTETSDGVIDALINSYVKRMMQKQMNYIPSENEIDDLLGFVGAMPVQEYKSGIDADLLGFQNEKQCFLFRDNIVYLNLLF